MKKIKFIDHCKGDILQTEITEANHHIHISVTRGSILLVSNQFILLTGSIKILEEKYLIGTLIMVPDILPSGYEQTCGFEVSCITEGLMN